MTITLSLTDQQERRLADGASRHDREAVRRVLLQAVEEAVDSLAGPSPHSGLPGGDFEALATELADRLAATTPPGRRPLSDEALTRSGIYGDHP